MGYTVSRPQLVNMFVKTSIPDLLQAELKLCDLAPNFAPDWEEAYLVVWRQKQMPIFPTLPENGWSDLPSIREYVSSVQQVTALFPGDLRRASLPAFNDDDLGAVDKYELVEVWAITDWSELLQE